MMENTNKIIIFGASLYGKVAFNVLKDKYEIVAFSDNDEKKWSNSFCGIKVIPPDEIKEFENVKIIIASQYSRSIGIQLRELGFSDIGIFIYKDKLVNQEEYHGEYEIIYSKFGNIFGNVKLDKDSIVKVINNYSNNYSQRKTRKKVLFIAYLFPPIGGSGVQRSVKFVKYLRDEGYEPVVLTVGKNVHNQDIDKEMLNDIPEDVQIVRINDELKNIMELSDVEQQEIINLYYGVVQSEEWIDKYITIINNDTSNVRSELIPDSHIYWVNNVLKSIDYKVNMQEIDLVFTTGYPYSAYFLGYYIKKKYDIPWVMDDRDAWIANDYLSEIMWFKGKHATYDLEYELNGKMLNEVDCLITMAEQVSRDYISKFNINKEHVKQITNGYDEEDIQDISSTEKNEKFTLCYNGWVYLDRNPVVLLKIINSMIEDKEIDKDKIQWVFNGVIQVDIQERLISEDKFNILKFNGYLEHLDSLNIASKSDALVLWGGIGEGAKVMYTGKIFEYLRLKRPIIGFSTSGGVFDEVFNATKCGQNFEYDDIDKIKQYLGYLYGKWKNNEIVCVGNNKEIEKYERRNLTKKLADIFNDLLKN
ncbi:MAG: hypothetical protein K2M78_05155 [Lachnospiraceae bacterium]|nr:hypothetical protein [Lachnospiraceae bacterium]